MMCLLGWLLNLRRCLRLCLNVGRLKVLQPLIGSLPPAVGYLTPQEKEKARDRRRRQADNLRGLYNTKRWRCLKTGTRMRVLDRDGWVCQQTGVQLTADKNQPNSAIVDHIKPHRGNLLLFWDECNLQAVSKSYHDSEKQKQERAADAAAGRGGVNP